MPTARTKINLQRTLLIVLGIILAFILTLNAKTLYSSESLIGPKSNSIEKGIPASTPSKKTGMMLLHGFVEKLSSLK
jgi:hypothetical protein